MSLKQQASFHKKFTLWIENCRILREGGVDPAVGVHHVGGHSVSNNTINWVAWRKTSDKSVCFFCTFGTFKVIFAHLSLPWSIGWVALSFLVWLVVVRPAMVTSDQISTSTSPRPPNPYIFWKLMIIAIQKWIRNTNTKTKTNTKTMTKTNTPRE